MKSQNIKLSKSALLKAKVLSQGNTTGDWVTLDNLDKARLVCDGNTVVVENEHGTTYGLEELSTKELSVFAYVYSIPEPAKLATLGAGPAEFSPLPSKSESVVYLGTMPEAILGFPKGSKIVYRKTEAAGREYIFNAIALAEGDKVWSYIVDNNGLSEPTDSVALPMTPDQYKLLISLVGSDHLQLPADYLIDMIKPYSN